MCYNPKREHAKEFIKNLSNDLEIISSLGPPVIILGDMNIDISMPDATSSVLIEQLEVFGLPDDASDLSWPP